jgi:hypothetical protein
VTTVALLFLLVVSPSFADRASSGTGVMEPYIRCDGFAGGVRAVTLDRRPADAPRWRTVELPAKSERVSVVDGYRVMYSYPRTLPFARLNAERSDPASYEADKRTLTRHFAGIAQGDDNAALSASSTAGFAIQSLTKKGLGGTTLGITQLLSDADGVIVTIYFLNQVPELRQFESYDEFVRLRDEFISGYAVCVAARRAPAKRR